MLETFFYRAFCAYQSSGSGSFQLSGVSILPCREGICAQFPDGYRADFIYPDSNLVYTAVTAIHGHYAFEYCSSHLFKHGLIVRCHSGGMRQITRVVR